MQQGLLLESCLAARPWANLEQVVLQAPADALSPERLRAAWETLAQRHDALRMCLVPDGQGHIVQKVLAAPTIELVTHPGPAPDMNRFLAEDRLAGIDTANRPGWRVTLFQGLPHSVMVWTIHHALIDGTSLAHVMEELGLLVQALPPGPAPQQGLAGFSAALALQDKPAARAFFADMFKNGTAPQPFLPDANVVPGRMAIVTNSLTRAQSDGLRARMRQIGVTPLNAVQLAWSLVLSRWTGQAEVGFGLVDSGRSLMPGLDRTVGCLISTLPLNVQLNGRSPVTDTLLWLRRVTLEMRRHAHANPTDVRRWANLPGGASLFDTIVMYSNATLEGRLRNLGGVWNDWSVRLIEEGTAGATLAVANDPEMLILLEHDPARLPDAKAKDLVAQVTQLLTAMVEMPDDLRIGDLDMVSAQDAATLLAMGQPKTHLPQQPACIARRFQAMADAHQLSIAVIDAQTGQSLSYSALERCSNALALRLVALGVGQGDIVGLHLPRGPAHIAALLAVLKCGAAFLPLDPDLPQAWLEGLMSRAGAKALIAPEGAALAHPVRLAPDLSAGADDPPPLAGPDPDRLAYVLFTSGSTGEPKAVRGLCGALSAHASAVALEYGLGRDDRVLHFAGLGFDVALEEIVPTLLTGACVVARDGAAAGSVRSCLDLMTRHGVTVANLPASFWHVMVEDMAATGQRPPDSLRLMVTGSERIRPQALRKWRDMVPGVDWVNGYGPTETTITATAFTLPKGAALPAVLDEVPIGLALGHAKAVLRAPDGSLTPKGGRGVLWIGGPAVTGGYLGDAARSDAAFQPDPWQPGGRLYCTGDQAFWRDDGLLGFLGRGDRQIKLRGHRIDLHQIEQLLAGLAGVRQAHVALSEDNTSRLLGWVLTDPGTRVSDLQRAARRNLPRAMVPHLIMMDHLPTGPNGKVDTRALPVPEPELQSALSVPDDKLTRAIAACMAEVLEREFVPSDAGFSDLGGDSLLGLRLVSLIEQRTGHVLQTADLHNNGSAVGLAEMLQHGSSRPRYCIPIQPNGDKPTFFAIHVLGRNEDLFRPLSAALGPDQPFFGLSVGIPRNLDDISVERTARLYFDEIQTFHPEGPVGLGAVSMAAYFAFELAQMLRAAGREVRVLAVLDAMGPDGRPALTGAAKLRAHLSQVRKHGPAHFIRVAKNKYDRYREHREALHSTPDQINPLNLIAANVCAVEFYQPQPYGGPLTVFRADHSFWDSPEALETALGWVSVAKGGLQMFDLPGTHLSILEPGNVEVLADHLKRMMAHPRS